MKELKEKFELFYYQYYGIFGNVFNTLNEILEIDKNNFMAIIIKIYFLEGTHSKDSEIIQNLLKKLKEIQENEKKELSNIEKLHLKAIHLVLDGERISATKIFEEILKVNPKDKFTLKICQDYYYYLGFFKVKN
jgi:hypothetical protein